MSNLVNYTAPPKGPSPMTRAEETTLASLRNALEYTSSVGLFSISDQRAPDGHERLNLELRHREISDCMLKSDPRSVVQRVSRLFMRFPSTRLDGNAEATMAAYATDLSVFPIWAIDAACKEIIAGHAEGSKSFAPSSVELRSICERIVMPFRSEMRQISEVLNAEIYHEPTPEVRAGVVRDFRALVDELKMNEDPIDRGGKKRPLTRDEAKAALDRALADPQPVPKFSPALRKHLGLPDETGPAPSAQPAKQGAAA